MKKRLLLIFLGAALVVGLLIGANQFFFRDVIFNANLEALTEGEDSIFGRRGHEVKECGEVQIEWNGNKTTCYHIIISCNFWGNNGCTETQTCPVHGPFNQ